MQTNWQLYGALFSAILIVSWAAPLITLVEAPGPIIAFYRLFFAVGLLGLLCFRTTVAFPWSFSFVDWGYLLAAGICLALHFGLWISALSHTSITSAVVLIATQPLFCVALSYLLLEEKLTRPLASGILLAIGGTALVSYTDLISSLQSLYGDFLALLGALAGVVYFIIGRKLREQHEVIPYVLSVFAIAAICLGSFCAWRGWPFLGYRGEDFLLLSLLAAGPTILGHGLFNWSLRYLPATTVNLALLGEPVLASAIAFVLFSERHHPLLYLGGGLILTGIFLGMQEAPSHPIRAESPIGCEESAGSL